MKKNTLLKICLFSFICCLLFSVSAFLIHVEPVLIFADIAILVCVVSFIAYLCCLVFNKFKHSVNVIVIIVFASIAVIGRLLDTNEVYIESIQGLLKASYITQVWICAALATLISIMVLIGRMIFGRSGSEKTASEENSTIVEMKVEEKSDSAVPQEQKMGTEEK